MTFLVNKTTINPFKKKKKEESGPVFYPFCVFFFLARRAMQTNSHFLDENYFAEIINLPKNILICVCVGGGTYLRWGGGKRIRGLVKFFLKDFLTKNIFQRDHAGFGRDFELSLAEKEHKKTNKHPMRKRQRKSLVYVFKILVKFFC